MRENPEDILAFNAKTTQRVSDLIHAMITYSLTFGEAIDFLNNEESFEIIELADILVEEEQL